MVYDVYMSSGHSSWGSSRGCRVCNRPPVSRRTEECYAFPAQQYFILAFAISIARRLIGQRGSAQPIYQLSQLTTPLSESQHDQGHMLVQRAPQGVRFDLLFKSSWRAPPVRAGREADA